MRRILAGLHHLHYLVLSINNIPPSLWLALSPPHCSILYNLSLLFQSKPFYDSMLRVVCVCVCVREMEHMQTIVGDSTRVQYYVSFGVEHSRESLLLLPAAAAVSVLRLGHIVISVRAANIEAVGKYVLSLSHSLQVVHPEPRSNP